MNKNDYLGLYAGGWAKGDASLILEAVSDDYTFDDPNSGIITKPNFSSYFDELKNTIKQQCDGIIPDPFMELSEVVIDEGEGITTAWCWWAVPGTELKGSGLIKVGVFGVKSEVIAYYTKLGS